MDHSDHIISGVDLGSTYAKVALINDDGKPEIIPNSDNERITPSAVYFEESLESGKIGNAVVGTIAREMAKLEPERVISFVKREMGTGWHREIDGVSLTPEAVYTYILKRLVCDARLSGHEVNDVVMTCPAYFDVAGHEAVKKVADAVGLNLLRVISEPVAAAIHYGLDKIGGRHAAVVYDLGGTTFDVAVLSIEEGKVNVVCCEGDSRLGGTDWDGRIAEFLASRFSEATGVDREAMLKDNDAYCDLQLQAEIVKQTLTVRTSAKTKVSFGGESVRIEITREVFEELTRDLLERTVFFTEKALDVAATKGVSQIDNCVLVGGATRMPQVMAIIKEKFASRITNAPLTFEVDEAVAKGAALFGARCSPSFIGDLTGEPGSNAGNELPAGGMETAGVITFLPRASRSYGVRFAADASPTVENMIVKDDVLPLECEREFAVPLGCSDKIGFQVYANETAERTAPANGCEEIGEVVVRLPHDRSGGMMVRIRMSLSDEGKLSLDVSYLTVKPGTPAHVEFLVAPELDDCDYERARREFAELAIE